MSGVTGSTDGGSIVSILREKEKRKKKMWREEASNSTGQVDLLSSGNANTTHVCVYIYIYIWCIVPVSVSRVSGSNVVSSAEARKRTVEQSRREKSTTRAYGRARHKGIAERVQ